MSRRKEHLEGLTFGRLTVLKRLEEKNGERALWLCKCLCGNMVKKTTTSLRSGNVSSCGCMIKDVARERHTKHGQKGTRLYMIWVDMRRRCRNKKYHAYKDYGERGITVCKEWDEDFMAFYNWSMSHGYSDNLSIDRINNNDGYYPENCRWATDIEQCNNKRDCHYVTIGNETKSLSDWCRYYGNNVNMVRERIKRGCGEKKAIQTPQLQYHKKREGHA